LFKILVSFSSARVRVRVVHPGQRLEIELHRGLDAGHHLDGGLLAVVAEVLFHEGLRQGLAHHLVGEANAALPARLEDLRSGQDLTELEPLRRRTCARATARAISRGASGGTYASRPL